MCHVCHGEKSFKKKLPLISILALLTKSHKLFTIKHILRTHIIARILTKNI